MHARSVISCGLDGRSGQLFERQLTADHDDVLGWLAELPAPVTVTYEAGPTGYGLARALRAAGIECRVAAPPKLARPSGDRVKTDKRDARHLARLLHLDDIVEVAVPSVEQETRGIWCGPATRPPRSDGRSTSGLQAAAALVGHRVCRRDAVDENRLFVMKLGGRRRHALSSLNGAGLVNQEVVPLVVELRRRPDVQAAVSV